MKIKFTSLIIKTCLLLLIFFSCEKNEKAILSTGVQYDSIITNYVKTYFIDLNNDDTKDIAIQWTNEPLAENVTIYKTWKLHQGAEIHTTQQTQPVCKDTSYLPQFWITTEKNCQDSTDPIRIDSFFATPNLAATNLENTDISASIGDTALIYKKITTTTMPSPSANTLDLEYGFFSHTNSGHLIFKLNGKRIALEISNQPLPVSFIKLKQIDL